MGRRRWSNFLELASFHLRKTVQRIAMPPREAATAMRIVAVAPLSSLVLAAAADRVGVSVLEAWSTDAVRVIVGTMVLVEGAGACVTLRTGVVVSTGGAEVDVDVVLVEVEVEVVEVVLSVVVDVDVEVPVVVVPVVVPVVVVVPEVVVEELGTALVEVVELVVLVVVLPRPGMIPAPTTGGGTVSWGRGDRFFMRRLEWSRRWSGTSWASTEVAIRSDR